MARNMTTQLSRIVPPGDRARSRRTGVARHLLSVSVIALLFGLSPAAAQFRIDRAGEVTDAGSGVIQGTVGYLADTATGGGDNLGDHVATMPLSMSGFAITGIATPDGTDPGAGVNVQYVDDMFGAYEPPQPDLSDYVTKSGMPQTITSAKTFGGPVLFSDDVQVTKVPSSTRDVTNKAYVDDAIDDLVTLTTSQTVSGDKSFTGAVSVPTPTRTAGAANKLYVDNAIATAGGNYVTMGTNQIIGGTPITGAKGFTGAVTFGGEVNVTSVPDDANDVVNKAYVDTLTDGLAGRVTAVEGDVTALKASVTTLQGDVVSLRRDVTTLRGDVSTLDTRVTNLANRKIDAGAGITTTGTLGGGITVAVDPTVMRTSGAQTVSGVKSFSAPIVGSITGTATALATPRAINGVAFDGSAAITLPTVNTSGDQTVGGVKSFASFPTIPVATNPTADNQVVSKKYADSLAFNITRTLMTPYYNVLVRATGAYASPHDLYETGLTVASAPANTKRVVCATLVTDDGRGPDYTAEGCYYVNRGDVVTTSTYRASIGIKVNGVDIWSLPKVPGPFLIAGEFVPSNTPSIKVSGRGTDVQTDVTVYEYLMPIP